MNLIRNRLFITFLMCLMAVVSFSTCGDDNEYTGDDDDTAINDDDHQSDDDDDDSADDDDDTGGDDDDTGGDDDDVPEDVMNPPDEVPFTIEREQVGIAPTTQEIAAFSETMRDFYEGVDFFRWASRHSVGLPENNAWEEPSYKVWWTNAYAIKSGENVTFTWSFPPDNSMAKVGRVLPAVMSYYLTTGDAVSRGLVLGYIRGLSACYDGMVWGDEDPAIDTIMARAIFHRNHSYEADGGRFITVDYDSIRHEDFSRRHDTIHNPENPVWGDIWIRNKRSKDDLPYLYRDMVMLARLIRETNDAELREAALKLYRQVGAMSVDIVTHGYHIRTKGVDGEIYIPRNEYGLIEDFASFTAYDLLAPSGECPAKLSTAYLATNGDSLGNDCGDGISALYELVANFGHSWSSNIIWGFHISALALSLGVEDNEAALSLAEGMVARLEQIKASFFREMYPEWDPQIAQTMVMAATYGVPLTNEEARYVQEQFSAAAEHYSQFEYWDLWDAAIPDGEYGYIPDRYEYDGYGETIRAHVRVAELADLYEYCYSPLKARNGAQFIDCEMLLGITD